MRWFSIEDNLFTGEFDCLGVPRYVEKLFINGNKFHGSFAFPRLPIGLIEVNVADNKFSGVVDLSRIPAEAVLKINLSNNMFENVLNIPKRVVVITDGNPLQKRISQNAM